jgi:hypothetical protein
LAGRLRRTGRMSRKITIKIRARGPTDSPTVEDLLDQLRDYFQILCEVEEAVAEDGRQAVEWRIVSATTNTPLTFEAAAFPKDFGVNIDNRVEAITRAAAIGLKALQAGAERPAYFTDRVLARAERFFERVSNGLDETVIDYGAGLPGLAVTTPVARRAAANVRSVLAPQARPYKELGSIEGNAQSVERDGYGRRILWVKYRLTGEIVKCTVTGDAVRELEGHQIKDIWRYRRVQVHGMLHYRGIGDLREVDAIEIRFLRERSELPTIDDIIDPNFTGGIRSEDYLARLRDGDT